VIHLGVKLSDQLKKEVHGEQFDPNFNSTIR
jgi:hypothetical protein